jgi:hypothetical protein
MSCGEAVPLWWQILWFLFVLAVVAAGWAGWHLYRRLHR